MGADEGAVVLQPPPPQREEEQQQPQPKQLQPQRPQQQVPETALALKSLAAAGAALSFAPGSDKVWACAPDGSILALEAATGATAQTLEVTGEPVCLAATHAGKSLAVGMASGKVELNDLPGVDFDDFLARATSPVRDVAFSASDRWAAVASDDLEVLLVDVATREVTQLKGKGAHDGGLRSVCFDPQEAFLLSLGADGQACVWDLASKACVWSRRVVERSVSVSGDPHLVVPRGAWRPDGGVLALPGARQPLLVERGSWRVLPADASAAALAHANDTSVLAWAPDGKVLASAGLDRRVLLWAAPAGSPGAALRATHVYTVAPASGAAADEGQQGQGQGQGLCVRNLAWTKDRMLAVLTADGSFAFQAVPASAAVASAAVAADEAAAAKAKGSAQQQETSGSGGGSTSDDESTASKKEKKKGKATSGAAGLLDDEASVGDKDGEEDEKSEAARATQEEHPPEEEEDGESAMDMDGDSVSKAGRMVEAPDMQGPFLPSSSPLDAAKRFLVWSPVGSIVSQNLGDHHAIEVEFADASRRPVRFTDHYGFVMGSLADDGAIFASVALGGAEEDGGAVSKENDDEERSTVFFRPFSNYSQKNQWLYTLPNGESALCVAVGARWAAVATTRQWVRLFTFSGLQDGILALPGPVVTMVGRGDLLAIFYHGGSPLVSADGAASQCLHFQLLDVRRSAVVASGPLTLSPRVGGGALLQWCGFSNLDILHAMDSEGVVYGLVKGFGWHWTPLLETQRLKRNKLDAFWPVGVHGPSLMCTLLKGGDEHPSTHPKPLVTSLPFKLPLVAVGGGSGDQGLLGLEQTRLLARAFLNQKAHQQEMLANEGLEEPALEEELLRDQAALDAQLIKMLQMAAANENGERMVEVAEQLHLQKSLELAIRVADHYSLPQVAGKISDILGARFPPVYEDEVEDLGAASYAPSPQPQQGRRAGLLGKAMGRMEEDDHHSGGVLADDGEGSLGGGGMDPDESSQQQQQQQQPAAAASGLKFGGAKTGGNGGGSSAPAAAAAARNPFALKKDQANGGKGGEKRPRGIAESLGSLLGSPSPKKPVLQKTSSFARSASEIRSKKKHDKRA